MCYLIRFKGSQFESWHFTDKTRWTIQEDEKAGGQTESKKGLITRFPSSSHHWYDQEASL